jgi:hypothetical protein
MTTTTATDLERLRDPEPGAYLDSVRTGDVERFRQLLADDSQWTAVSLPRCQRAGRNHSAR